jgi:predicted metal-dependent hydrolase
MNDGNENTSDPFGATGGQGMDVRYLGFFECFNRQRYFEAHEVLEAIWLPLRHGPDGLFYKGLIQMAGGFVHAQKRRLGPAAALFGLAHANLSRYAGIHQGLDVGQMLQSLDRWRRAAAAGDAGEDLTDLAHAPQIALKFAP